MRQSKIKQLFLGIYRNLHKGNVIEFGLINNLTKLVCKNSKDHTVANVTTFTRTTKYIRDESDIICIN